MAELDLASSGFDRCEQHGQARMAREWRPSKNMMEPGLEAAEGEKGWRGAG